MPFNDLLIAETTINVVIISSNNLRIMVETVRFCFLISVHHITLKTLQSNDRYTNLVNPSMLNFMPHGTTGDPFFIYT